MVRIERLIMVVLGVALLQAWWKLYRGKVKRWWKRTKDRMPRHWQPKSPADCPRCQGGEEIEEVVLPHCVYHEIYSPAWVTKKRPKFTALRAFVNF